MCGFYARVIFPRVLELSIGGAALAKEGPMRSSPRTEKYSKWASVPVSTCRITREA